MADDSENVSKWTKTRIDQFLTRKMGHAYWVGNAACRLTTRAIENLGIPRFEEVWVKKTYRRKFTDAEARAILQEVRRMEGQAEIDRLERLARLRGKPRAPRGRK